MSLFSSKIKSRLLNVAAILLAVGTMLSLGACANNSRQTGNLPDAAKVRQLQVGQSSKADVVELVGTPSSQSAFSDKTWYYVSQNRRRRALLKDKIEKQVVLVLGFDSSDVLQGAKVYTLKDGQTIRPNGNATPTSGRKLSFFEQLIGSIGRTAQ